MRKLTQSPLSTFLVALVLSLATAASIQAQESREVSQDPPSAKSQPAEPVTEYPDSPGSVLAKAQDPAQQQSSAASPAPSQVPQANGSDDQKLQRPVGTAAAEAPKVSGITAAQPAGVAIAPAKQHRVRTIVLKVGAIAGAAAAIGTVVALSEATPSKPPGAH